MIKLVKPLTGFMLLAILCGSLGFLAAQFIPVLGAYAVLGGLGSAPLSVKTVVTALPLLALARAVLRLSEQRANHFIAFKLLAVIRDKVFFALRKLCPAKLEGRDKGDLISLISSDVELLEVFYAHTISPICIAFLTELVMCIFIGSFHWSLGLLSFAAFALIGIALPLIISRRSGSLGDELRSRSGALASYMLENIRGLDEIIQFGAGRKRLEEMDRRTDELAADQGRQSRLSGFNSALAGSMILVSDIAMLLLAGSLYIKGSLDIAGFIIPLIALMSAFGPVTALAALGTTLQTTIAAGSRVLGIMDESPETEDITGREKTEFNGAALKDVSFSYGGETVFDGLSLSFPENRITGIVGKSGCGKSTMLKLLMRFWNASSGEVLLSGKNVQQINTSDLRDMESYMTQETQLFKDSIANNIRIGRLDAGDDEVAEACKKASLHDFIMTLPSGYDTQLKELGESLSGGERQRIGLARAFLHDAPFMLLDEPTSNLDSLNEAVILKALKEEAEDKTIVLVSHRSSTVRIADPVIHMEAGRLS